MSIQPVRGTRDLLGEDYDKYHFLCQTALSILPLYGYHGIETPIIEYTSLFQRGLGETTDIVGKEMYTFLTRGEESLTLRPEGTASVTRAVIHAGLTQTLPQKLFYIGPMFRYERPQKGRYRQFYHLGVECIGLSHPMADAECIALADHFLKSCEFSDYQLHLNTLGDLESRQAYRQALVEYFSRYKNDLSADSQVRLEKNPLRILDSKSPQDQIICEQAPLFENFLNASSKDFFNNVQAGLSILGIPFTHNQKLVRGLDYYCHTAFEFKTQSLGAQDAILAGGRYDGLAQQLGGTALPAVGWASGLDRLMLLLSGFKQPKIFRIALIAIEENLQSGALNLMQQLRQHDIACEMPLNGNLSKRLKQADKTNCQIAILLGPEEYQAQKVKIRFLDDVCSPSQEKEIVILISEVIPYLLSLRKI
jgi:histidyl-tRNA synthetase